MFLKTLFVSCLCWISSAFATNYSVIIIGAGPAGVAAAAKLLENNITNILILEAEPRIGGRIHSVFFGDAYVELGAQWCHGKTDNVVYNLAKPLVPLVPDDADTELLYSDGVLDSDFQNELNQILWEDEHQPEDTNKNLTMQEFYLPSYEEVVRKKYGNNTEKLKVALAAKRLLEQYILSYEGAFHLNDVVAVSDFVIASNESDYSWQGIGYKTILDILIHKFPNESNTLPFHEKVKLNEEVIQIRWNESEGVVVDVAGGGSYRGALVIFTPSLNVLKHDHGKLFVPQLPQNKQAAMQNLGMDAVMKIHAHFTQRWWPVTDGYSFIWGEEALREVEHTNFAWVVNVCGILPAAKNPKVLTAWIVGPNVPKIELLSNEEIALGIEFLLKKFLHSKYNITTPDNILKSGWHNNPHFRGTYSYQTVAAVLKRPSPEVVLAEPLSNGAHENVVCFAGEATHPQFYSTVHGAIESGYREASRIISTQLEKIKLNQYFLNNVF